MQKLEIIDGAFKKDDPHKDIGKQKFRVKRRYSMWVEYDVVADSKDEAETAVSEQGGVKKIEWEDGYHKDEPVEVYAYDYDSDYDDTDKTVKVEECVPYEDYDSDTGKHFDNYEDPEWTGDQYRWTQEEKEEKAEQSNSTEVPF